MSLINLDNYPSDITELDINNKLLEGGILDLQKFTNLIKCY